MMNFYLAFDEEEEKRIKRVILIKRIMVIIGGITLAGQWASVIAYYVTKETTFLVLAKVLGPVAIGINMGSIFVKP